MWRNRSRQRGSILMMVLIVVAVIMITVTGMFVYVYDVHRINERALALEKASATAEAGLYQLMHFFNVPDSIPEDLSANKTLIEEFFENDRDPSAIQGAGMVFVDADSDLHTDLIQMNEGAVTRLEVTEPRANAAAGTMFTLRSVAYAEPLKGMKVYRTAVMDVGFTASEDPFPEVSLPAAVISGAGVAANGQLNVHWGEAWSKGNMSLKMGFQRTKNMAFPAWNVQSDNNMSNLGNDQWVKFRTAGYILDDQGNRIVDSLAYNGIAQYIANASDRANYYSATGPNDILKQHEDLFTPAGQQTLSQKIDGILDTFGKLNDSETGYLFWRDLAIRRNMYFRPSANGSAVYNASGQRLYLSSAGELNVDGYGTALSASGALDYARTVSNCRLIFFDTTNGQPPAANTSNWANLNFTGAISSRTRGILYVAGNLSIGGSGNPPSIPIKAPDASEHQQNVFHDGAIFTYGDFNYQGNPIIYGSVVCRGSFDCGGTPNIYYKDPNVQDEDDTPPSSSRTQRLATVIE